MFDKVFKVLIMVFLFIFCLLFYIQTNKYLFLYNKYLSVEFLKFSHDYMYKELKQPYYEKEHLLETGFILLDQTLTYGLPLHVSLNEKELNKFIEDRKRIEK